MSQVISLSFYRFDSVGTRLWAFAMMGLARRHMRRVPGIGFWKLCGSGTGEGFTPIPNTAVYAILATWPNLEVAEHQTGYSSIFERYRTTADEDWTVYLRTESARGVWASETPFEISDETEAGPLAVLTRATIKPTRALRFWQRVPNISEVIGKDPNVAFKIGIGEIPWLHQITFSIWPDSQMMAGFARRGHHAQAIKAVREGNWFSEELYARFRVVAECGSWGGTSPLDKLEHSL